MPVRFLAAGGHRAPAVGNRSVYAGWPSSGVRLRVAALTMPGSAAEKVNNPSLNQYL